MVTEVQPSNLSVAVASHIRNQILSGRLSPDVKIDQDALADELGVSRQPVREALIALSVEGLVRLVPRKGAFVAPLTPRDVMDHFAIYGLVSGLAARRAAEAASPDLVEKLSTAHRELIEAQKWERQAESNEVFHREINRAGGSRRLLAVLRTMARSMPTDFFDAPGWHEVACDDHEKILEAIRNRDGDTAHASMVQHLERSGKWTVDMLSERGIWDD